MPFPDPVPRKKLHTRTIVCEGFHRDDGLWDIEAWMTDVKTYGFPNHDRGGIEAGEPLHGMGLRVTCNDEMVIVAAVAVTDYAPFHQCPEIAPAYENLVGLRIGKGFDAKVREIFAGAAGCTHLRELLRPLATTAFQTIFAVREKKRRESDSQMQRRPGILDTCYALRSDGPVVEREWPQFYEGPSTNEAGEPSEAADGPSPSRAPITEI